MRQVEELDRDFKRLKEEIFKLAWYMRGSVTIDEAFGLCYEDRLIISDIIKENLEITQKSGMPFF